jgi:AraC-like DNA-binding protein
MASSDWFRYLPHLPDDDLWGIAVSGAGQARAGRNHPYPPVGHPADHAFDWQTGRVLHGFQIVFISEGQGRFESRQGGLHPVTAGDALLVFPSVWHRYQPDPRTGWFERWVELDGPSVRRLLGAGVFDASRPVLALRDPGKFSRLMDELLELVRSAKPGAREEAGAIGHLLLAQLQALPGAGKRASPGAGMVAAAERLLAEKIEHPVPIPDLARQIGVSYSYFRREFKARTGLSPKRYQQRMRLERARRLLGSTVESLDQIAERVGFSSAFHLSAEFKKEFGLPPRDWRRQFPPK